MTRFTCLDVDGDWRHVATPDDLTVRVELDRTTHEYYPALRELVLLYDAVATGRETEFAIGTGDSVAVTSADDGSLVAIDLPPLRFTAERDEVVAALESVLAEIFERKDATSSHDQRREGLDVVQRWLDEHDADTDVRRLYERLES